MRKHFTLMLVLLFIFGGLDANISIILDGYIPFYNLNLFKTEIIDARAEALGRTSILSSSGANNIFNNPAMLCNLDRRNIQFSFRSIVGSSEMEYKYESEYLKYLYKYPFHSKLNGLSLAIPFRISNIKHLRLGFGVGFRSNFDWAHKEEVSSNQENGTYFANYIGGYNTLVIGSSIGYKKLLLGFSINFALLNNFVIEEQDNINGTSKTEKKGSIKGHFYTINSTYFLSEKIVLGSKLRTSYTVEIEENYESKFKYVANIIIPLELGLAIEINSNANLKIFAEYLTRHFGKYKLDTNSEINNLYDDSNNGFSLRSGIEIGSKNVVRGGFFIQSVPIYTHSGYSDEGGIYYDYEGDEKPQSEIGFTTGLGVKLIPSISLDFFGVFSFLNYEYDRETGSLNRTISYSHSLLKIGCSLGFYF